jgi:hypothetical protein
MKWRKKTIESCLRAKPSLFLGDALSEPLEQGRGKTERTCFVAGTLVKVHPETVNSRQIKGESYKDIDKLQIGDLVLSANEHTGELSYRPVTELFVHDVKLIHRLTYKEGLTVETTWNHPFWVQDKGWTEAKDLHAGERSVTARSILKGKRPRLQTVSFTSNVQPGFDDPSLVTWDDAREGTLSVARVEEVHRADKVYNIEVEGNHTYFVTEEGVLVHNYKVQTGDGWNTVMRKVGLDPNNPADREKFMAMKITSGCPGGRTSCTVADQYRATVGGGVPWFATGQEIEQEGDGLSLDKVRDSVGQDVATSMSNMNGGRILSKLFHSAVDAVSSWIGISQETPSSGNSTYPLPAGTITSGMYRPNGDYHGGIDIVNGHGTPVYATVDGDVYYTVDDCTAGNMTCGGGFGNTVYMTDSNGNRYIYGHLDSVVISKGKVARGQQIGTQGNTGHSVGQNCLPAVGNTCGSHLHYEIVDPKGYQLDPVSGQRERLKPGF